MPFPEAKQYHIGLKRGDLAPTLLLCGDPGRVEKITKFLTDTTAPIQHREYVTVTGRYEGIPVSVMATGMGSDNTEIALIEIAQILKEATLIRIGSCGGLKKGVELADLVISTGAVRMENTTNAYVCGGYPAIAHYEVTQALIEAAKQLKHRFHVGITATAPGFYAPQGRTVSPFPTLEPDLPQKLEKMNVTNMEMEASALFVLAHLAGFRAGCVCAVYANRHAGKFIDDKTMKIAEERCIQVGLRAVQLLKNKE